ncbi:MAG: hypothetical protein FJX42_10670, partial [Alphaproteobacteria bacterium]|nr:hypothetical protein [Alphaproteobacteria bacterium]
MSPRPPAAPPRPPRESGGARPLRRAALLAAALLAAPLTNLAGPGESLAARAPLDQGGDGPAAAQPSDLLRRIQRALSAIGLYQGRADGIMGPETEAAIRAYQRTTGLTITGQPSEALADRLDAGDKVNDLLGKLERARTENIRAAREALLANPATRDLVADEIAERTDPTRDIQPCLKAPNAACLLAEAVESSKAVADRELRDWSLGEILAAEARAGLTRNARETARRIRDPRLIMVALRDIAEAQARGGFAAEALAAAETIPDALKRAEALAAIADIHAAGEKADAAAAAARRLGETVGELSEPAQQSAFRARLAVVLNHLDKDAAEKILVEAETAARALPAQQRGGALRLVAVALAETGRTGEALRLLNEVPDKADHIPVLTAAVIREARAGNAPTAHALAATIAETHHRAGVLGPVAVAQYRAGNARAAEASLVAALDASDQISYPFAKSYALSKIALSLIEFADVQKSAAGRGAELARAASV